MAWYGDPEGHARAARKRGRKVNDAAAKKERNIERARQAQRRGNAKLGTKKANSAIKSYNKAEAFKAAAFGEKPHGKKKRRKR